MAKIIGREKEIQTLAEAMKSERSEFVAVYGRRRIGKTFLIKEYFNNKFSFLFVGTRGISKATQLDNFALALQRQFAIDFKPALQNWFDAFHLLEDLLTKKRTKGKRVVFIDETPWMDSPKSDFVPALELFWNGWANMRDDIVLQEEVVEKPQLTEEEERSVKERRVLKTTIWAFAAVSAAIMVYVVYSLYQLLT